MNENKTDLPDGRNRAGKYFKYAIGEIVLVVMGILIALQINNWNEERKDSIFENKVLSELHMDVKEDLQEMNTAIDSISKDQMSSHLIVQHLEDKKEYHDSLDVYFADILKLWSLSPNMTSFEMAKAEGMYLIKNDSIRYYSSKINGYSFDYVQVLEHRFQDYKSNVVLPYIQPLFNSYNFTSMKPNDYEALREDTTYLSIMKSIISMRGRYSNMLNIRYNQLSKLDEIIIKELK